MPPGMRDNTQLLTLTRAARLVGTTRGALQKLVKSGKLTTFEGMVVSAELQRLFPSVSFTNSETLARYARIKDTAYAKRLREHVLPSPEVLSTRLAQITQDLVTARDMADRYRELFNRLENRLHAYDKKSSHSTLAELRTWLHDEYARLLPSAGPDPLVVEDGILRIMSAHALVMPSRHEFFIEGNDTLLEAALRAGLAFNYGCSSGNCGLCKGKVLSGQVMKTRPHDYVLTDAEKAAGEILLCCHTAVTDLVFEAHEASGAHEIPRQALTARVRLIESLDADTRLLHLQTPRSQRLRFLAGQAVLLAAADGASMELPIASCPCDDRNLHFHVRRTPGDPFAEQVFGRLRVSDAITLDGPTGNFVLHDDALRPLVFLAWDTGFAPIKSLIEHAQSLEAGEMHLYWLADREKGHYQQNLCRAWADALDGFRFTPLIVPPSAGQAGFEAALEKVVADHPDLNECDVYAAGSADLVEAARKVLLPAGLAKERLHSGYAR